MQDSNSDLQPEHTGSNPVGADGKTFGLKIIFLLASVVLCVFQLNLSPHNKLTPPILLPNPIYFQSIKRTSVLTSGISLSPLLLFTIFAVITSSIINQKISYYTPTTLSGAILIAIGASLLSKLHPSSPAHHWISYQGINSLSTYS